MGVLGSIVDTTERMKVWAEESIVITNDERRTLFGTSAAVKDADMQLVEHVELLEGLIQHCVEKLAWSKPSYNQCKKEHLSQLDLPDPRVLEFNDLD